MLAARRFLRWPMLPGDCDKKNLHQLHLLLHAPMMKQLWGWVIRQRLAHTARPLLEICPLLCAAMITRQATGTECNTYNMIVLLNTILNSSNALSSYFHDLGMRSRLCELVTNTADGGGGWLNSSASPTQTLGGNYGEVTPADLGFTLSSLVTEASDSCEVTPDAPKTTYSNTLSSLSAAEMTRRIALHRDVPPSLQFPGVVWEDVQV